MAPIRLTFKVKGAPDCNTVKNVTEFQGNRNVCTALLLVVAVLSSRTLSQSFRHLQSCIMLQGSAYVCQCQNTYDSCSQTVSHINQHPRDVYM